MTATTSKSFWESSRDSLVGIVTSETFLYIIKRLLQALLTIFLASIVSFVIIQFAPGDYLDNLRQNPKISPERILQLQQQFGLDKPWHIQYFLWLWRIISKGDFGTSFVYQRSVASLIWERVPATLLLAITSLICT
ncbi:MAG: ABC transporter permease, partial [Rivularia sp. (in: cyanobacteria)]